MDASAYSTRFVDATAHGPRPRPPIMTSCSQTLRRSIGSIGNRGRVPTVPPEVRCIVAQLSTAPSITESPLRRSTAQPQIEPCPRSSSASALYVPSALLREAALVRVRVTRFIEHSPSPSQNDVQGWRRRSLSPPLGRRACSRLTGSASSSTLIAPSRLASRDCEVAEHSETLRSPPPSFPVSREDAECLVAAACRDRSKSPQLPTHRTRG